MLTRISPSRPRRSTAHRLLQLDPERTTAMELLALNSPQHRFTGRWSLELDSSPAKPLAIGRDSRFHPEDWTVQGKLDCRTLAYPKSSGIGAFNRVSPATNPVHARSLLRAQNRRP